MNKVFWLKRTDTGFDCGVCDHGENPTEDIAILLELSEKDGLFAAWNYAENWLRNRLDYWYPKSNEATNYPPPRPPNFECIDDEEPF